MYRLVPNIIFSVIIALTSASTIIKRSKPGYILHNLYFSLTIVCIHLQITIIFIKAYNLVNGFFTEDTLCQTDLYLSSMVPLFKLLKRQIIMRIMHEIFSCLKIMLKRAVFDKYRVSSCGLNNLFYL